MSEVRRHTEVNPRGLVPSPRTFVLRNEAKTCTIITGEPSELVREIHTRVPVILPDEHHEAWLVAGEAGKVILVPFPGKRTNAWPIS